MKTYCPYCMEPLSNGMCQNGCAPVISDDAHVLHPGTRLHNRYLVGRVLGQGGFGITYIGRDLILDTCVAIKEYFPKQMVIRDTSVSLEVHATSQKMHEFLSQGYEKFLKEARILARFRGEKGIVEVLDFFQENNTAYIVMEYLDGHTLLTYLGQLGKMPLDQVLSLLAPVISSLDMLHQAGLIHRDISPENIMLTADGQVKLLDFGTVRNANPEGKHKLTVMLKRGYAPAEQYLENGRQGPWTDVYALSATIYRCITGIVPKEGMARLVQDTVQPPSELGVSISPAQETALMKGMACDYEKRFQSVGELAAALCAGTNPADLTELVTKLTDASVDGCGVLTVPKVVPTSQLANCKKQNVLMGTIWPEDRTSLMEDPDFTFYGDPIDFCLSEPFRCSISAIIFLDTLDECPDDARDVSEAQDGSVMAWMKPNGSNLYDLYIGAEGGVSAPADCTCLFACYGNVKSIHFNGAFNTSNVTKMNSMFHNCSSLTALDMSGFRTAKGEYMDGMFSGCANLTALNLRSFDTTNVKSMEKMFSGCENLTTLDLRSFDTTNVKSMGKMFSGCENLTVMDLSGFRTGKVEYMDGMFSDCRNLMALNMRSFDTANVVHMQCMFSGCANLTALDLIEFDTAKVIFMDNMFSGCRNLMTLDLRSFDTTNVKSMEKMFSDCESLTTLDLSGFKTANVIHMDGMFSGCANLTALNLRSFRTAKVTSMRRMFQGCNKLTALHVKNWKTSYTKNWRTYKVLTDGMFDACSLPGDVVSAILSGKTVST